MDDDREWLDLDEAAERMGLSKSEVMHLCQIRALRCEYVGYGVFLVEPAIVRGAVQTP